MGCSHGQRAHRPRQRHLVGPAADTFPGLPAFSEYLADDLLWGRLDRLARRYQGAGYRLI